MSPFPYASRQIAAPRLATNFSNTTFIIAISCCYHNQKMLYFSRYETIFVSYFSKEITPMASKPTILLFHIEPAKSKQIETLCRSLKIQVIKVKMTSYAQQLGYLANIDGFNRKSGSYQGAEFPAEMMVFSGIDDTTLDTFLAKYKEASIPAIGLKAILTQHNIFWTPEELFRELFKEHLHLGIK
jgi:hypothetical protein